MLVYGECECFVMQMLYVCVLCASFFFFFLKRRFIEINKTIYRIVEIQDIRNTDRVKREI